jgi:hypothetical protein
MHIVRYCAAERCCVLISTTFCSIVPMFDSLPEVRLLLHLEFVVCRLLPNKCWEVSCDKLLTFTADALQVLCCHALTLYWPVQVITNQAVSSHFTAITPCLEELPPPNLFIDRVAAVPRNCRDQNLV